MYLAFSWLGTADLRQTSPATVPGPSGVPQTHSQLPRYLPAGRSMCRPPTAPGLGTSAWLHSLCIHRLAQLQEARRWSIILSAHHHFLSFMNGPHSKVHVNKGILQFGVFSLINDIKQHVIIIHINEFTNYVNLLPNSDQMKIKLFWRHIKTWLQFSTSNIFYRILILT